MTDDELHVTELVESYDGMDSWVAESLSDEYVAELEAEWERIADDVEVNERAEASEQKVETVKLILAEASLRSKEMSDEEVAETLAFFGMTEDDIRGDD